jgi:hypothetical protein
VKRNRVILFALVAAATAVITAVTALQGSMALAHLTLDVAPFLIVAGLLICGRFIGEDRMIARLIARRAHLRPLRRAASHRHDRPLASMLARGPRHLRGPPAVAAAA